MSKKRRGRPKKLVSHNMQELVSMIQNYKAKTGIGRAFFLKSYGIKSRTRDSRIARSCIDPVVLDSMLEFFKENE